MVTIREIASESGYSISTVSRVLNKKGDVSPAAKKKIEEVVEKYQFVPNNNAKNLKQTNTKTVGVLVKGIANMLFSYIVEDIQQMIAKTDYTLTVTYLDEEADEVHEAVAMCRERKPVGLLFLGGDPRHFSSGFENIDVPCVLVTNQAEGSPFDNLSSVATDDRSASRCVMDKLFSYGHQKIGVIGGNLETSHTSLRRYQGCVDSFEANGAVWDDKKCYVNARYDYKSAYHAVGELLEKYPDLTAIFAMSDVMAVGAIRALHDRGLRVPEDISVVGFDGTALAEYYSPRLATIQQKYNTMASRSLEILINQLELKNGCVREVVPFAFVDGESIRRLNG